MKLNLLAVGLLFGCVAAAGCQSETAVESNSNMETTRTSASTGDSYSRDVPDMLKGVSTGKPKTGKS